ncbi:MAG: S9 family peptidase, partial [Bacteroidales bacterium]
MKKYGIAILLFSIIFTCHAHDIKVLQLRYAGPVAVKKPILSDSLNVYGKAYEEINLLKNELSLTKLLNDFIILEADSKGKIVFSGLQDQYSLHLFSFNLIPDRFVKGKLKVTGPGMFEIYANGKKLKDKVTSDTLFFISTDLNLEPREYEISIKYLSPKEAKKESSLQIEYIYDDSSAVVEATVSNETRYTIYNLQDGKNFRSVALSPNGQYALVGYSERANAETESYKQLIETTTGKMILTEDGYLNEARWMPTSNLLYYTRKGLKGKELITLDPATLQENILDRELPEGSFYFTPDEKTLIFSIKEEGPKEENSMIRIVDPNDRQESYRTRYHLAIYSLSTGLLETLTYGYKTTQLQDISHDSRSILISTSEYDYTRRPFSSTSLYRIDLQTFKIDTIFQNQLYLGGFTFSP